MTKSTNINGPHARNLRLGTVFASKVLLLSCMIVPACSQNIPSDLSGRLLFFNRTVEQFDFDTDQYYSVRKFDGLGEQEFLSTGPGDSIMILMESPGQDFPFHQSVFIQSTRSMDQDWQMKFPYPTFKCYNLDYDKSSNHYLFSGLIRDTLGIFELDRDLNVLRKRTTIDVCGKNQTLVAYFLQGDSIMVRCGSRILIGSWSSDNLDLLGEGFISAVSPNREYALFTSPREGPMSLFELECNTGAVRRLPISCFVVLHATYSPDGRYIAYNERLNRLVHTTKVSIYDRLEEKTWKTDMYNDASFVWLGSK